MDPEVTLETPTETPSGEAPEDMTGTPPTEIDEVDVPGADEGLEPGEREESDSWKSLAAKYPDKTGAELRKMVGDQYWEAKNYASGKARENEELRAMLAERDGEGPEDEPGEPPPHPQIEALDKRIQGLYDKDQVTSKTQNETLVKLADADKNIAKIEARLEDAQERTKAPDLEEYQKTRAESAVGTFEARLEAARAGRQSILDRYGTLNDKRENYGHEMEKLLTDKDWLTKVQTKQVNDAKSAKVADVRFNADFPKYVDSLIEESADSLEAPEEKRLRQSLGRHVNRAMMVELMNVGETDLDELDVPGMVEGYVKEYLTDRDLVSRERFERKSAAKRKVAGKGTTSTPVPAAKRPPVPPSLMSTGDTTPGMLAARKYLQTRKL